MQWIIRTDEPFRGHAQSVVNPNGTVAYSNGQTLEEYRATCGFPVRVLSSDEFDKMLDSFHNTLKTRPERITKERFWEMLEILPPCRWHNAGGFEFFHVSERHTGNLVSWFAHQGNHYWEFVDEASIPDAKLVELLSAT